MIMNIIFDICFLVYFDRVELQKYKFVKVIKYVSDGCLFILIRSERPLQTVIPAALRINCYRESFTQ